MKVCLTLFLLNYFAFDKDCGISIHFMVGNSDFDIFVFSNCNILGVCIWKSGVLFLGHAWRCMLFIVKTVLLRILP